MKKFFSILWIFLFILLFFVLFITAVQNEFSPMIYPISVTIFAFIILYISPNIIFLMREKNNFGLFIITIAALSLLIFMTSTIFLYSRGMYSSLANTYAIRIALCYDIIIGILCLIFSDRSNR